MRLCHLATAERINLGKTLTLTLALTFYVSLYVSLALTLTLTLIPTAGVLRERRLRHGV